MIAAGCWSGSLLDPLGIEARLRPVRGQMLWYDRVPEPPRHIVLGDDLYVIPRRDGVCLVGSTLEDVGFDRGVGRPVSGADCARRSRRRSPWSGPAGRTGGFLPASAITGRA